MSGRDTNSDFHNKGCKLLKRTNSRLPSLAASDECSVVNAVRTNLNARVDHPAQRPRTPDCRHRCHSTRSQFVVFFFFFFVVASTWLSYVLLVLPVQVPVPASTVPGGTSSPAGRAPCRVRRGCRRSPAASGTGRSRKRRCRSRGQRRDPCRHSAMVRPTGQRRTSASSSSRVGMRSVSGSKGRRLGGAGAGGLRCIRRADRRSLAAARRGCRGLFPLGRAESSPGRLRADPRAGGGRGWRGCCRCRGRRRWHGGELRAGGSVAVADSAKRPEPWPSRNAAAWTRAAMRSGMVGAVRSCWGSVGAGSEVGAAAWSMAVVLTRMLEYVNRNVLAAAGCVWVVRVCFVAD